MMAPIHKIRFWNASGFWFSSKIKDLRCLHIWTMEGRTVFVMCFTQSSNISKTCWLPWLALLQGSAVWSLTCGWCVCSKLYLGFLDRFSEAFLLDCKIFARTKNNLWKISLMLYYRDCFLDFNVDFWRSRHVTHTNTCRQVLFHSVLSVLFRPQPLGCTRLNLAQKQAYVIVWALSKALITDNGIDTE